MNLRLALLVLPLCLGACSSTYHPEYHPVVSYSQEGSYPPAVVVPGDGTQRPVVVVTPPPTAPTVPPPPPGFFTPQ
jgi:hypothetical protein